MAFPLDLSVHVTGLSRPFNPDDLGDQLSADFGRVRRVQSGARSFAFIHFEDASGATNCVRGMQSGSYTFQGLVLRSSRALTRNGESTGPGACRFGSNCRREVCRFTHPRPGPRGERDEGHDRTRDRERDRDRDRDRDRSRPDRRPDERRPDDRRDRRPDDRNRRPDDRDRRPDDRRDRHPDDRDPRRETRDRPRDDRGRRDDARGDIRGRSEFGLYPDRHGGDRGRDAQPADAGRGFELPPPPAPEAAAAAAGGIAPYPPPYPPYPYPPPPHGYPAAYPPYPYPPPPPGYGGPPPPGYGGPPPTGDRSNGGFPRGPPSSGGDPATAGGAPPDPYYGRPPPPAGYPPYPPPPHAVPPHGYPPHGPDAAAAPHDKRGYDARYAGGQGGGRPYPGGSQDANQGGYQGAHGASKPGGPAPAPAATDRHPPHQQHSGFTEGSIWQ